MYKASREALKNIYIYVKYKCLQIKSSTETGGSKWTEKKLN